MSPLEREAKRKERLAKSLTLQQIPEMSDPRTQRRAIKVLDFAYDLRLMPHQSMAMKAVNFYKIIGNKGRGPADYFASLFRQVGAYTKQGGTYKYAPITKRVTRLAETLDYAGGLVSAAGRKGWSFHDDPGPRALLPRTGDRVYPWWAMMERETRKELFVQTLGGGYDYDIEAAKPTLTLQAWRGLMAKHKPEMLQKSECSLPAWSEMVTDRTAYRAKLAREADITVPQAKEVIQSVLNSAWASPHFKNGICEAIGKDATLRLMEAPSYKALRSDFKVFMRELRDLETLAGLNLFAMGNSDGEVLSAFYNRMEDEIMTIVDKELEGTRTWFVHDGFMTTELMNTNSLESKILDETGYVLRIEMKEL